MKKSRPCSPITGVEAEGWPKLPVSCAVSVATYGEPIEVPSMMLSSLTKHGFPFTVQSKLPPIISCSVVRQLVTLHGAPVVG